MLGTFVEASATRRGARGATMPRRRTWAGALGVVLLLAGTPARAVIIRPTPLSYFLEVSTAIVTARVESLDPGRPATVLAVDGHLKGKLPFARLAVHLEGDAVAARGKETPLL